MRRHRQALLAQRLGVIRHSLTRFVKAILDGVANAGEPLEIGRVEAKKIWLFGCFDYQ